MSTPGKNSNFWQLRRISRLNVLNKMKSVPRSKREEKIALVTFQDADYLKLLAMVYLQIRTLPRLGRVEKWKQS